MKLTVNEAKETKIFVIEENRIEETNLYDHVMISAEETTSPRGVERMLHIRDNEENNTFDVYCWQYRGSKLTFVESFDTEEEAENDIFERTYKYDFENDDQRMTSYYMSYDEAFESLAEYLEISIETLKSIKHHEELKKQIIENRKQKQIEIAKENQARIFNLAKIYSKMIEKIENESYKETCQRLSNTIGEKIESAVFHTAVKLIRK